MVSLSIPARLAFRDLLLRVISSSCKLARHGSQLQSAGQRSEDQDEFESHIVSACGEAFNNVVFHGYAGHDASDGRVDVEVDIAPEGITVRLFDWGARFDPSQHGELPPDSLPESKMGLYIINAFVDEVRYRAGEPPTTPNMLSLTKRLKRS